MSPELKGTILLGLLTVFIAAFAIISVSVILSFQESRKYSYRMEAYTFCVQTAKTGGVENAETQCLNKF